MSVLTLPTGRLTLRRPHPSDWNACRDFFMSDRAAGIGGPYDLGKAWRAFAAGRRGANPMLSHED